MLYVRWKQEEIELHLNKQSYGNAYKHTYFMKIMRPVQIWNVFPVQPSPNASDFVKSQTFRGRLVVHQKGARDIRIIKAHMALKPTHYQSEDKAAHHQPWHFISFFFTQNLLNVKFCLQKQ